jgi:hypothetical protein
VTTFATRGSSQPRPFLSLLCGLGGLGVRPSPPMRPDPEREDRNLLTQRSQRSRRKCWVRATRVSWALLKAPAPLGRQARRGDSWAVFGARQLVLFSVYFGIKDERPVRTGKTNRRG